MLDIAHPTGRRFFETQVVSGPAEEYRDIYRAHARRVLAAAFGEGGVKAEPGVMHPVDQAFYHLAVKERDYERVRCDRLTRERDEARAQCDRLTAAIEHLLGLWRDDDEELVVKAGASEADDAIIEALAAIGAR